MEAMMNYQKPESPAFVAVLLIAALIPFIVTGCGGSGGGGGEVTATGSSVSVVFPPQSAMLLKGGALTAAVAQDSSRHGTLAGIISKIQRFCQVDSAFAQATPASVSRMQLVVTGPGITSPITTDINPSTGRAVVDVPEGVDRVFEVQAFPLGLPLANFIGRVTADVPSTGVSITIDMQSVTLNSIQVTPTNPQIARGTIQRFTATGNFSDGTLQDITALVDWASSDPSVAVISNAEGIEGLASAAAEGTTNITATFTNISGEATLTVTDAEVVAVTVTPAIPSIAVGIRLQFVATGIFTDGTSQDLTQVATWTSSSPTVASITTLGLATALDVGSTTISASFQDISGEAVLSVAPIQLAAISVTPADPSIAVGTRLQFVATGIFTDGHSMDLTSSVTWVSSSPGFASITSPGGLATAIAAGDTTISATLQSVTGTTNLTVRSLELAAITVTPAIPSIAIGTRLQFIATGIFTNGTSQDLTNSATWVSSSPNIADISNAQGSRGLATALVAGNTTVSASFLNLSGNTTLTVTDAQLAAITVTPAIPGIAIGTRLQFVATGIFTNGTNQNLSAQAAWTTDAPNVCSVSPLGLAIGLAAGSCTVSATFQNISGSTTLTVRDVELAAITVTPAISAIAAGTVLQFVATGLFTDGTSQDLTASASWAASPPNLCAITPAGLATATNPGSCTVGATFTTVTGNATLTITDARLVAITVAPATPTIAVGTVLQFVATGLFTDGTSQDLTASASWAASPPNLCAITPAGLATGLAIGSCTINASSQGVSGSATLTVRNVQLAAIVVTPSNPTVVLGASLQFIATGIFDDGLTQDLSASATWEADDGEVASIGPQGLATAIGLGDTEILATSGVISGSTVMTVSDGPDLVPVAVEGDFCISNQLVIEVENQGTVNANTFSTVRVTFSPGGSVDFAIPPLAFDTSLQRSISFPDGCFDSGDGDCDFSIAVDVTDVISEVNEQNNTATGSCDFTIE